jgi:hypothetical protein
MRGTSRILVWAKFELAVTWRRCARSTGAATGWKVTNTSTEETTMASKPELPGTNELDVGFVALHEMKESAMRGGFSEAQAMELVTEAFRQMMLNGMNSSFGNE